MKKSVIKTQAGKNRVANIIAKEIRSAVSIFTNTPKVEVKEETDWFTNIYIKGEDNFCKMLTFAEIDTVREVVDLYAKKYEYGTITYTMQASQYLTSDGQNWLPQPVLEVCVKQTNYKF